MLVTSQLPIQTTKIFSF